MSQNPADELPSIATGLPPGWIELVAFSSVDVLASFLRAQLAVDADRFDDDEIERIVDACVRAHAVAAPQRWLHLGCVVTEFPVEETSRNTVWTIGVGVITPPSFGDVDPVAVASRVVGSLGEISQVERFSTDDGREGVVFGGTTSATSLPDGLTDADVVRMLPQIDLAALGLYAVVMPLRGLPDRLVLTLGVAPCVEERQAMSVLAGQMAASVHAIADLAAYPRANVLVDRTGAVHERGFLAAEDTEPAESTRG
ncbi:hypothetical protein [Nocardioides acrostichi]|uniref:Uncharacterized protein n=1 Tax=Nocardioides acrostichi TaxID=2784339 RepID=A0A930YBY7_9ACTN|nr:hypothetical protein [Nocardioides acrostichi]MBF4160944.1 hypothetical protein [Nocardioides acrostichi]